MPVDIVSGGSTPTAYRSHDSRRYGSRQGYGLVLEDPDTDLFALSEEHGQLDLRRSSRKYKIGERVKIIPNHVCATINMHDEIYGVRNGGRGNKLESDGVRAGSVAASRSETNREHVCVLQLET